MLTAPPNNIELRFDEVVSERVAAARSDIGAAVILSPATTSVGVGWHRYRLTVGLKGGFRPGRVYRLELLPVLVDLHQNRMKVGKTIVFSTGPQIPGATLRGAVVDWPGGRPAPGALIEAVMLPDSLPYRTLADSAGSFFLSQMPPGTYLVYGVLDQNGNRRRDPREAFDTSRVTLRDSAAVELYAFTHDTLGPRPRSVDLLDSVTIRVVFDRPLDPTQVVDTSMVKVAPAADSTQSLPLVQVLTPAAFDSANKAEAAARAARDTTHRRPAPPTPPLAPEAAPRRDSTPGTKMLARRPAPTDNRIVRLASALEPGKRYVVFVAGPKGLTGITGHGRAQITVPVPRPRRPPPDTLHAAPNAPRDTLRAAPAAPRDTLTGRPKPR